MRTLGHDHAVACHFPLPRQRGRRGGDGSDNGCPGRGQRLSGAAGRRDVPARPSTGSEGRESSVKLRVLMEPRHGATYDQILALARTTEEAGFDAFFRSDHYLGVDADDLSYLPTDSWTTLAGLAARRAGSASARS